MTYLRYDDSHRHGQSAPAAAPLRSPSESSSLAHTISQQSHAGWRVTIAERVVGLTIRRRLYFAVLHREYDGVEHVMSAFPSPQAAREAAQRWIETSASLARMARMRRTAQQFRWRLRRPSES